MDPQFQELAATLTRDVGEAVKATVDAAEKRLSEQARINVEAVKSEARLAAEGYAATVESIQADLAGIRATLDKKISLYDSVLTNHNDRIVALEHKGG